MYPPQPVRPQRRSRGDVLAGVAAVGALAALVFGVPAALVSCFGPPVPRHLPSLDTLTQPVGVDTILGILAVLVWLAWLQLVVCVLVEVRAAIRGVGVPARVPLSGGTQALAHRLVSTALLLFTATVAVAPVLAPRHTPPTRPAHAVTAVQTPGHHADASSAPEARTEQPADVSHAHQGPVKKKIYRVRPPHGRHHESLWEIAEKCLGDGRRYKEIYELNKGREQPDGTKLTIASLIRPGWVLEMPHDATGVEVVTELPPSAGHGGHAGAGAHGTPGGGGVSAGHGSLGATAGNGTGGAAGAAGGGEAGGAGAGGAAGDAQPGAAGHGVAAPGGPAGAPSQHTAWPFPDELAAASLLAAGVLAALGRRRREQLWQRAFGRRAVPPEGEAAFAEVAVRLGADEPAARALDLGLRGLSRALAAAGRVLPTVYAAHIGADQLSLWVYPGDRNPPAPWTASDQGQVWVLPVAEAQRLDPRELAGIPAPYPGLVSIGTNETGRILVDLEAAHGLIALRGPAEVTRAALAALAVELATSRWSDEMRLTLVGFGDDLVRLAPDRVRAVDDLAAVLPELEAHTEETRRALAALGHESVLTGRSLDRGGPACVPHYLIMATPPSPEEEAALVRLARTGPRTATGYVVAGDVAGATWTWDITADGHLRAGVLGLQVLAQLLPERQYTAIVELFRTATRFDGLPPLPGPDDPAPAVTEPDAACAVEVRLLGRVEVSAPGPLDPDRRALATEVVVYLAAHPEGVHPTVLAGAVWPRGASPAVRDATIARVRDWLGADDLGRPNLTVDVTGRLRLGSGVRVDWQVFRGLVARAGQAGDPVREAQLLRRALDLVRGPLLQGREATRYAWLAGDDLEYEAAARVADAAHRLVELRLAAGDAAGAVHAARSGLRFVADDAELWRDLLRATHATGDEAAVRAVVEAMHAQAADAVGGLPPLTEALVEEVLPRWRTKIAL